MSRLRVPWKGYQRAKTPAEKRRRQDMGAKIGLISIPVILVLGALSEALGVDTGLATGVLVVLLVVVLGFVDLRMGQARAPADKDDESSP